MHQVSRARSLASPLAPAALLLLAFAALACGGAKEPKTDPAAAATPPAPVAPTVAPPAPNHQVGPSGPQMPIIAPPAQSFKKAKKGYTPMCAGGVIKDDGQLETGYGYVPNASSGIYLQEYDAAELPNPALDHVCVCLLHKRTDTVLDFEVVFYEKKEGKPAEEPYATRPGHAEGVPLGKESGGLFYDVDVTGVQVVPGTSYIGLRWNPTVDPFFFICADHGPDSKVTPGYQRDDRAAGWLSILGSPDPIFMKHKAMMLRVVTQPALPQGAPEKVIYNKSIKRKNPPAAPPEPPKPATEKKTPPV
jgi:hypothetical protein